MPQNINVLIVDDHPFIIQGYKNVIKLFQIIRQPTMFKALGVQPILMMALIKGVFGLREESYMT